MVSCGKNYNEYNITTIFWTGTINTVQPMVYFDIWPEKHSYKIIKKNKKFVINLTSEKLAYATDFNGVKIGRDLNKFQKIHFTPVRKINMIIIGKLQHWYWM